MPARSPTTSRRWVRRSSSSASCCRPAPTCCPPPYLRRARRLQDDVEPLAADDVARDRRGGARRAAAEGVRAVRREPIAAASLGQVHRAALRNGREVVVKVQRPDIREQRRRRHGCARASSPPSLDDHTDVGRRVGFGEMVAEFADTMLRELDYRREAGNLERLARQPRGLRPRSSCRSRSASTRRSACSRWTTSRGRKVTTLDAARAHGDRRRRARATQLFRAYLDQILVDGFFHADPHPGNVLLTDDGRLALIDLGMVAHDRAAHAGQLVQAACSRSAKAVATRPAGIAIDIGRRSTTSTSTRSCAPRSALVAQSSAGIGGHRGRHAGQRALPRRGRDRVCGCRRSWRCSARRCSTSTRSRSSSRPGFDPSACVQDHAIDVLQPAACGRSRSRLGRDRARGPAVRRGAARCG